MGEKGGEKLGEKVGEKTGEKVGESLGEIHKLNLCRKQNHTLPKSEKNTVRKISKLETSDMATQQRS